MSAWKCREVFSLSRFPHRVTLYYHIYSLGHSSGLYRLTVGTSQLSIPFRITAAFGPEMRRHLSLHVVLLR